MFGGLRAASECGLSYPKRGAKQRRHLLGRRVVRPERKLPREQAPHPSCPGWGRARPPPAPPMAGMGGPSPPSRPPPGWGRAGSTGNLVYIAGNEAIGARDFPATCSPPSHPGLAPGLRGSCGGAAAAGTPPTRSQPSSASLLPPALAEALRTPGCFSGSSGVLRRGTRSQPRGQPGPGRAPFLEAPVSLLEPGASPGAARPHSRRYLDPWRSRSQSRGAEGPAGAGQPGGGGPGGCGRRCRRSRGPGPRRSPTGLPSAEAERPRWGQPGRGG